MIPTLFIITVISFGVSRLAPGDPAAAKVGVGSEGGMGEGSTINEKTIELIRKRAKSGTSLSIRMTRSPSLGWEPQAGGRTRERHFGARPGQAGLL